MTRNFIWVSEQTESQVGMVSSWPVTVHTGGRLMSYTYTKIT